MSTTTVPPTSTSPPNTAGVGNRRKGPKSLPKLPASAFSPPNSAISDNFPLAPSPSTLHPSGIIDTYVKYADIKQWESSTGDLVSKSQGIVVFVAPGENVSEDALKSTSAKILSVSSTFDLNEPSVPAPSGFGHPSALWTTIKEIQPESHAQLRAAISHGRPIDIHLGLDISDESTFERLQDLLTKATADITDTPAIILSNILPPPHDLSLPIVKLINHPTYQAYQAQIATLSLFPRTYIKFTPPAWGESTPSGDSEESIKQKKEWKRRIKMFLGPAIEAFGYERILFGSTGASSQATLAGAWYDIARESFAELNTEQDVLDAIFGLNAIKVYSA